MAYTTTKYYDQMFARSQFIFLCLKFKRSRVLGDDFDTLDEEFQNKMLEEMINNVGVDLLFKNKLVIHQLIKYCCKHKVTQHTRLNHAKQILDKHVNNLKELETENISQ